ncbi:hypothetical protein, partial [Treponema sp. R6D11]
GMLVLESKDSETEILKLAMKHNLRKQKKLMTDSNYAIINILAYLKSAKATMQRFVDSLPQSYIAKRMAEISPENKAKVMRILSESFAQEPYQTETKDGLKIRGNDAYAVVMPHKNENKISITTEGLTQEFADELADICYKTIKSSE